ncbi:M14 family murein peptide amidase A [Herminiimonas sp. CN]|uniref:M14 family murein peptide amidase A n=1 Tax=Herminiimonas sp. CN TaxID=1349818 RepID=UPI000473ACD6|nr:M14 family murein peptide amidase A [Herminiimonas sp. CN]
MPRAGTIVRRRPPCRVRCCIAVGLALLGLSGAASPAQAETAPDWCQRLSNRLHSVSLASCLNSGLLPTGVKSHKGFPILARDIAPANSKNASKAAPPLRILLIGGIHGDELTSVSIVFRWLQWAQMPPAQMFRWKIVPVVNPDGLLATKPSRVNAHGVDLNRNFPTPNWQAEAPRYWAQTTRSDPRRFPGTAPLSEPESRWVQKEIERFRPQLIVSVHAPFGVLDFDGAEKPPQRFGHLIYNRVGIYPGSLGNYGGLHKNIPVITIELPNARAMPPDAEVQRIWQDMLDWIQRNLPAQAPPLEASTAASRKLAQ